MNFWLVKSEPSTYSWDQLLKEKKVIWDGVRNYTARNNLRLMKKGDNVLFYHSNTGMCITGIATVSKEYFQDPTTQDKNWVAVELSPLSTFKNQIDLKEIKSNPILKNMLLVKQSRLSVMPVKKEEIAEIIRLSEK